MLELFGSGYVIEHCIAAFSLSQKRKLFEVYITDCLKLIAENTAGLSRQGKYLKLRYLDIADKPQKPVETRSAEEIIDDIKTKMAKQFGGKEVSEE